MKDQLSAGAILSMVGEDSELAELALETKVDVQVKKLDGQTMLKLLLYGVLSNDRVSLRVLEEAYESQRFKTYAGIANEQTTAHSTLSDRLRHIKVGFFEQVYQRVLKRFGEEVQPPYQTENGVKFRVNRVDSTLVSCSAKLLSIGMVNGRRKKTNEPNRFKQVKFTLGFNGLLPQVAHIHTAQSDLADDRPLAEAVRALSIEPDSVAVFDRGLKSRKVMASFVKEGRYFVTRINRTQQYEVVEKQALPDIHQTDTLELISDQTVRLAINGNISKKVLFRLIIARSLQSGETLYFLSNLFEVSAVDVTEIYRLRWEIEVFFRFLKQEMNFSHMLSRDLNGIQVMLYVTLIAAALIMVFRRRNRINSYKIAKIRFVNQLYDDLIKIVIQFCGGDPSLYGRVVSPGFGH